MMEVNVNITDTGAYFVSQKLLGIPVPVFTLHISRQSDYFRYLILLVVCDDVRGGGNTV